MHRLGFTFILKVADPAWATSPAAARSEKAAQTRQRVSQQIDQDQHLDRGLNDLRLRLGRPQERLADGRVPLLGVKPHFAGDCPRFGHGAEGPQ